MEPTLTNAEQSINTRKSKRQRVQRRRLHKIRNLFFGALFSTVFVVLGLYIIGFVTPWGKHWRMIAAETIISTRHYYLAHYITTSAEYKDLVKQLHAPVIKTGLPTYVHVSNSTSTIAPVQQPKPVEIHSIAGKGWNGYVMLVHNPKLVRLVAAHVHNGFGEYITDIGKRTHAVAGTNASGFQDPKGEGWGGEPVGLEYINGQVVHPPKGTADWATVGFTNKGVMVMGRYSIAELRKMHVRDAMQFHPELVVNGKPTITHGDGGWGYGPRTAIGQTKNGTVIFIVVNGRFHGGSGMGASQRQVMNLMLHYGAVNACAMDGGSSSVLDHNNVIVNSPSTIDPNGQRHLPDAWMVFSTMQAANQSGS